jgi:ribA/ribD-fused uncharacterized protein
MSDPSAILRGVTDLPSSVEELRTFAEPDVPIKFLFFWGHRPRADGSVGAGCLSQWWPAAFTVDGVTFGSAEHYMMWRKAMLFGDEESARRIVVAGHPRQAKELGRGVQGFDDQTWAAERFGIVIDASLAKFGQHPELRDFLVGTAKRVLVEASPTDRVWGIGLSATDERTTDPARWRGLNLLGFALMQARARLAAA